MSFKLKVTLIGCVESVDAPAARKIAEQYIPDGNFDIEIEIPNKKNPAMLRTLRLPNHEMTSGSINVEEAENAFKFLIDGEFEIKWKGSKFKKSDFVDQTDHELTRIIGTKKIEALDEVNYRDDQALFPGIINSTVIEKIEIT